MASDLTIKVIIEPAFMAQIDEMSDRLVKSVGDELLSPVEAMRLAVDFLEEELPKHLRMEPA